MYFHDSCRLCTHLHTLCERISEYRIFWFYNNDVRVCVYFQLTLFRVIQVLEEFRTACHRWIGNWTQIVLLTGHFTKLPAVVFKKTRKKYGKHARSFLTRILDRFPCSKANSIIALFIFFFFTIFVLYLLKTTGGVDNRHRSKSRAGRTRGTERGQGRGSGSGVGA